MAPVKKFGSSIRTGTHGWEARRQAGRSTVQGQTEVYERQGTGGGDGEQWKEGKMEDVGIRVREGRGKVDGEGWRYRMQRKTAMNGVRVGTGGWWKGGRGGTSKPFTGVLLWRMSRGGGIGGEWRGRRDGGGNLNTGTLHNTCESARARDHR